MKRSIVIITSLLLVFGLSDVFARDIEYRGQGEIIVHVQPGEPTQMQFPSKVAGGYRKTQSALFINPKENDLILFANEALAETGEALIVRLKDGRSYPIRVQRANEISPRDPQVRVKDLREKADLINEEEEIKPYDQREFERHNPNSVPGFMRELILAAEFGKSKIPGYRVSNQYKGETILQDGTLHATIDKIFVGPNMWGYVIDASNEMDISQKINPASFRLDGTRAISLSNWELAPKPLNIEQQITQKHTAKVYVITKPRK